MRLFAFFAAALTILTCTTPSQARVEQFPPGTRTEYIKTDGATIYVRVAGKGPAVVLLHGFGDTGDMWAPAAKVLVKDHTVVVPDLRGMGLSGHPEGGYDKKTQARDIAQVLDRLKIEKADLVTHDIGNMVGYALAAQYPDRITKWVVIDAPHPRHRAMGRNSEKPAAVALQFPRTRRRPAGQRPRAHLPRPFL